MCPSLFLFLRRYIVQPGTCYTVLASTASFDWWSVFIFLKISCFLFLLLHNRLIVNETYLAIFTIKNDFFKENYYDNTFLVLFPTPSFKKLFWLQKCTFILL